MVEHQMSLRYKTRLGYHILFVLFQVVAAAESFSPGRSLELPPSPFLMSLQRRLSHVLVSVQ
jgi:hypothetical protein